MGKLENGGEPESDVPEVDASAGTIELILVRLAVMVYVRRHVGVDMRTRVPERYAIARFGTLKTSANSGNLTFYRGLNAQQGGSN